MKNVLKHFLVILVGLIILEIFFSKNCSEAVNYATQTTDGGGSKSDSSFYIDITANTDGTSASYLSGVIGNLLGFLQIASGLFAVLMIALTGFNYIVSTPEVKEEMKKKMLPIIIGIVLVFGAVSIANFILGAVAG